jgi:hypothetical protein
MKRRSAIARGKEDYFVFGQTRKTLVIPGQPQRVGALRRPMTGSGLSPESITPVLMLAVTSLGAERGHREYGFRARARARPGMTER